jgi:integrase
MNLAFDAVDGHNRDMPLVPTKATWPSSLPCRKFIESKGAPGMRYLSEEEEAALLSECNEPLRTIVLLGIYAGLRINAEALTLKKDSVNLSRCLLTIEAAYSKNGETQTIPIHSKLVEPLRAVMKGSRDEYVFEGRQKKDSIRTAFENACERAKLRGVTPHTLRHTFASRLAMARGLATGPFRSSEDGSESK